MKGYRVPLNTESLSVQDRDLNNMSGMFGLVTSSVPTVKSINSELNTGSFAIYCEISFRWLNRSSIPCQPY